MRSLRGGIIVGVALFAAAPFGPAMAADGGGAVNWSGCYIGANAGAGRSIDRFSLSPAGNYLTAPGGAAPPNAAGSGDFAADIAALSHSSDKNGLGGIVGGQAGCNYQAAAFSVGSVVVGGEVDGQWTSMTSRVAASYPALANLGNPAFMDAAHTETVTSALRALATFRGRAGLAWDRLFGYVTGGLALGNIRSATNVTFGDAGALGVFNGATHIGSHSTTRLGWTIGTGAEYAFAPNWSLKAEYLYVDLGSYSYNSPLVAPAAAASAGYLWHSRVNEAEHILRVGLNFKFL